MGTFCNDFMSFSVSGFKNWDPSSGPSFTGLPELLPGELFTDPPAMGDPRIFFNRSSGICGDLGGGFPPSFVGERRSTMLNRGRGEARGGVDIPSSSSEIGTGVRLLDLGTGVRDRGAGLELLLREVPGSRSESPPPDFFPESARSNID